MHRCTDQLISCQIHSRALSAVVAVVNQVGGGGGVTPVWNGGGGGYARPNPGGGGGGGNLSSMSPSLLISAFIIYDLVFGRDLETAAGTQKYRAHLGLTCTFRHPCINLY